MVWRIDDPQGDEAGKVKYEIVEYTRGRVLDLGCGPTPAYPHFIGVDNYKDTELFGIQMRPAIAADCTKLSMFADGGVDAVFSSHLLEHVEDHVQALTEWWRVIRVGGYLILYLPHKDHYPNIGQEGANPDHKHDFVTKDIVDAMVAVTADGGAGWRLLRNEVRAEGREYSFLQVYQKRDDRTVMVAQDGRPKKTACVVRYGGFGDMIQTAAILPELKRQGYHITVMTTPKGQDILKHDPHIDRFFLQDNDQVPNNELVYFWEAQEKHFDKFVNLCESVEGTLLAIPGRANHAWPQAVRHAQLNVNYGEWTAQLAEIPYKAEGRFYPSDEERQSVEGYLSAIGFQDEFLIVWALSGSSIHKFYPHQDEAVAQILAACPRARIVMVGDYACKILEAGWESHPRVALESGEMSVRAILTLAQRANVVVGPETGVLNSVAFEPDVFKVCLLSHSSRENLTKHWLRTLPLVPVGTKCYPCHRLHYDSRFCSLHEETHAAMCQVNIPSEKVSRAVVSQYEYWSLLRQERTAA
jgi:predicted SAM-dependent methyltransferase